VIPDGTAYPAYTATCGGAFVLVGGQVCIDNTPNHQVFITVGGGPGLGGNGFQSGEGFIVDSQKPTACDVQNYLHGKSIQAGGGFIAGGEFVWGNEPASGLGNYGVTAGFVIPGISATISYGWQVGGPNAC
jgi:hypothetical protein